MTEERFEVYYDEYMENWKVQDIITLQIISCVSESVAKELGKKLNEQHETIQQLNQQLKKYREPNCRKCIEYSQDGVADYCMSEDGLLGGAWKMFPFEWDYTNAKDCKEYEE